MEGRTAKILSKRKVVSVIETKVKKRSRAAVSGPNKVKQESKIKEEIKDDSDAGLSGTSPVKKLIGNVFLGTSGYMYSHWKSGVYYPRGANQFQFYTAEFDSVELNSPFYRIPAAKTWEKWRHDAPYQSFTYIIKANQYFTHWRRLTVDDDLINRWRQFYDQGCRVLGPHLGPVLFQLPPKLSCDPVKLAVFTDILPADGRFVFEFRDRSWFCQEVYDILRSRNICLAAVNVCNKGKWAGTLQEGWNPELDQYMAGGSCCDWGYYIRLHGSSGQYVGSYSEQFIDTLAKHIVQCREGGRQVYVMCNNTDDGRPPSAIADLRNLKSCIQNIKRGS